MRIALLSPYSWTYPGGVTRHIEALSAELRGAGHDARILAPFDPDDALSRRLHSGARPQRRELREDLVPLGRTVGIPANGAVSNLCVTPSSVFAMREELRNGSYDVLHIHEPVVPVLGWDALLSLRELPLVGTFHTYSENLLTNGIAAVALGGRRRMNRLRVRIAVSDAAAWTARRFYGGRYRIIPNGVHLQLARAEADGAGAQARGERRPLRIAFVGQAVERKGLPILLAAFEALREHVPAQLTLVGASPEEIAHLMLDDRGVVALGKVSEQRKHAELAAADVLCAPSLHGESFGMVLTEAFAAGTPVLASDIPGYRDVVRDGLDGRLVPAGDPLALARALGEIAVDEPARRRMAASARERAERFAWPHVAAEVLDCYEHAIALGEGAPGWQGAAVRRGFVPADLQPRIPPERLASLQRDVPAPLVERRRRRLRRTAIALSSLGGGILAALGVQRMGLAPVAASLLASRPGLVAGAFGLMCAAMLLRAFAWHTLLAAAPTWRRAKRRDAMQGTFIGVLLSATMPARLGEPSRALIVARRIGRARESLPVVLSTMICQTLINVVALAALAGAGIAGAGVVGDRASSLLLLAIAPLAAPLASLLAPHLTSRDTGLRRRLAAALADARRSLVRVRAAVRLFARARVALLAAPAQLAAWALQWLCCWLVLSGLGIGSAGAGAAAGVLFAINVTALVPATPANVGVFQAACVAVLAGAYHVSVPEAIAYGIVLQAVELATALLMGLPALVNEDLGWRELRLRARHAAPLQLSAPELAGPRAAESKLA